MCRLHPAANHCSGSARAVVSTATGSELVRPGYSVRHRPCLVARESVPDPSHPLIDVFAHHDLPVDAQLRLGEELAQILEVRVLSDAYDMLSEAQGAELDGLVSGNQPELVSSDLQCHVAGLQGIDQRNVETLRQELSEHRRAAEAAARNAP